MTANPADELVDIVDEAGNVLFTATRHEVRTRRLLHKCVYLIVTNSAGDVLVHERTATKDVYPSFWDVTAGGVLAAGESFAEGAIREGLEELGVSPDWRPLFAFRWGDERTDVLGEVFAATCEGPFVFQPEEIVHGGFVALADLPALIAREPFCPDGLYVWQQARARQLA